MELKLFYGIVFSKMSRIGTRSEDPEYFIKLEIPNEFCQAELPIRKEVHLWQDDPVLQKCIGKKVELKGEPIYTQYIKFEGTIKSEGIIYKEIKPIT